MNCSQRACPRIRAAGVYFDRAPFCRIDAGCYVISRESDENLSIVSPRRHDPISAELHELQDAFNALDQTLNLDAFVAFSDCDDRVYPLLPTGEKDRAREIIDQLIARAEGLPDRTPQYDCPFCKRKKPRMRRR